MKKSEVKKYMDGVRNYLKLEYGEIRSEWEITLAILEDTIDRYNQVRDSIKANGIYSAISGRKNPLLSTEKDCLATILKLSQKLGISPWDASKIKNAPEDDTEDFIDNLTGESEVEDEGEE